MGNHARKPVIVKVPRNPCRTGRFPPINDVWRANALPVLGPPFERVVAPDVASSTPDLREVVLEILGVVVGELAERTLHASRRKAAPMRRGRAEVVGLEAGTVAGAGVGAGTGRGAGSRIVVPVLHGAGMHTT